MKDTPKKPARPSKRDVIVLGDDSANDQPLAKRVAEPVSPPDVVELQQKVLKLEENFQRVCCMARKEQLRAEAAENRLDEAHGLKNNFNAEKKRADDLELRLAASNRLEEVRRKEESNVHLELAVENETLKADMAKMTEENEQEKEVINKKLDDMTKEHQERSDGMESRMDEVSRQLEEERRKVSELTDQNADLKRSEHEQQKRNDELTRRLAQYEIALQPLLQLQQLNLMHPVAMSQSDGSPEEATSSAAIVVTSEEVVELRHVGHPLADSDLSEKLLDLVQKALNCNQLKRGLEATEKTLNLGTSEIIVLADFDHPKVQRKLPLLCQEKNVPYVFVKSADELAAASGEGHRTACSITRVEGSPLESLIREIKKDVQKLLHAPSTSTRNASFFAL